MFLIQVNKCCCVLTAGPCLNESCTDTFLPPKQRLRKIIRWRYPIAEQYLTSFIKMANQTQRADIIFLTAASDNHFLESQGLLADLYQKVFPFLRNNTHFTFRLVYYDLGLTEPQVLVVRFVLFLYLFFRIK